MRGWDLQVEAHSLSGLNAFCFIFFGVNSLQSISLSAKGDAMVVCFCPGSNNYNVKMKKVFLLFLFLVVEALKKKRRLSLFFRP